MSLDIVNMYPLVWVKLICKALNHYAKNLPATTRETIDLCMGIVQFVMKSTLIQFRGQYYVYQGASKGNELSDKDVALAISAYESAFLANIMASYVFEETEECFEICVFRGIYRDNGRRLPVVHHRTLATSSSQCGKLTYQEGQEAVGSNSDI
eukprot:538679-Ditylum_brightwellii.AAC.1